MMALAERRDRAADILADGLVSLIRSREQGGEADEKRKHDELGTAAAHTPHLRLVSDPPEREGQ